MISIQNLSFEYANFVALHNISVEIPKGSITALVGPNGAGKTTLMRCMAALARPSAGRVFIDAIDVAADPHACHRICGFLADNFGLYESLTVRQSLQYIVSAHGIDDAERADVLIERLDLVDKTNELIKNLSRGMRQRVGIAQAIVHSPQYLILDEPASGLDPEARIALSQLFKQLNAEGITLLVSSHILAELDQYANNLLILKDGAIVQSDFDIKENPQEQHYVIRASNINVLRGLYDEALFTLISHDGDSATISIKEGRTSQECMAYFISNGVQVSEFYKATVNIQDAYLKTIKNA